METCLFTTVEKATKCCVKFMWNRDQTHNTKDVICLLCRLLPIPANPRPTTRNQEVKCAVYVGQSTEAA